MREFTDIEIASIVDDLDILIKGFDAKIGKLSSGGVVCKNAKDVILYLYQVKKQVRNICEESN